MEGGSKALLALIEIVISLAIFAAAVVLTLQIFLTGKYLGDKTSDSTDAIFIMQNLAEELRTDRSILEEGGGSIYYDGEWNKVDTAQEAVFELRYAAEKKDYNYGGLYEYELSMYRTKPYPFINDKNIKADADFIPLLATIKTNKFAAESR